MNPVVHAALAAALVLLGLWLGHRNARYDRQLDERIALIRRQRQIDVLLSLRELIDAGDTAAACQLIDAEVSR